MPVAHNRAPTEPAGENLAPPLNPLPPFMKGRRVPVAHKQGADRSGSEDLDENFTSRESNCELQKITTRRNFYKFGVL